MKIQFNPHQGRGCIWHIDCPENEHNSGIVSPVAHYEDCSLMQCGHCKKMGFYPVGGVGCIEVDEVVPVSKKQVDRLKELVKDVDIDMDSPLQD